MTPAERPCSAACERNKHPILEVLKTYCADSRRVLEIGSGTGQHAVFFAGAMPYLQWQTSDRRENHDGIRQWLAHLRPDNVLAPLDLDVNGEWPQDRYDAVFTANTLHIMAWPEVETLFRRLPGVMTPDARLVIYGPFNYRGSFTSDSNAAFDQGLRRSARWMGIRDFEAVDALARGIGLRLLEDRAMPANNRCLVWQRQPVAR